MNLPDAGRLMDAMGATWPPVRSWQIGSVRIRDGAGGGKRVSSALGMGAVSADALSDATRDIAARGEIPLFQLQPGQVAFDRLLASTGYTVIDPTILYAAPIAPLANLPFHRLDAIAAEGPLAIHTDIWRQGGIGTGRQAVMARAVSPKRWILARVDDVPAGAGFAAIHNGIAIVHALQVVPRFRRRGAARAMLVRIALWARAEGASHLGLAVLESNSAARALCASLGIVPVGQYHYRILEGPQP